MVMAVIQMSILEQLFLILGEVQRFLSLKAKLKNQRLRQQRKRHCLRQQERRVRRTQLQVHLNQFSLQQLQLLLNQFSLGQLQLHQNQCIPRQLKKKSHVQLEKMQGL